MQRPATPMPTTEPAGEATLEPTPEPEARVDPTVVAQGFTADPGTDSASYAVVIENPNTTWVPRFVDVSITFLDAEGTELTTEMQSITGILPESETAVAGEAVGAGAATAMEVQISNLNSLARARCVRAWRRGHYDYEGVQTWPDASGGITTTGLVRSRFESEQINIPIYAVYYNAAGAVVGGAVTIVDQVPPGDEPRSRRARSSASPTSRRLASSARSGSGADGSTDTRPRRSAQGGIGPGSCVECPDGEVA